MRHIQFSYTLAAFLCLLMPLVNGCGESQDNDETAMADSSVPADVAVQDATPTPDAALQPACGDGLQQRGEACDDGNTVDDDGCDRNCTPTGCGNGVVTAGEGCDDGNRVDGDGCDSNCRPTACGNGIQTERENCDDGNRIEGDGCDTNCTVSACGNGIVAPGEGCDDGNTVDGDGCDGHCQPTGCGNGRLTTGEVCDDGNMINGDDCDENCLPTGCGNGITTEGERCDDGNVLDGDGCDSNCTVTACGNGVMTDGESCDDGNAVDGDGCDSNCRLSGCGNGIQTDSESCDDGNTVDGDGCDSNCTPTACGNGVTSAGEGCDDGNADDGDGCDSNCEPTGCGNGIITDTEICDDNNLTDGDGCDSNCRPTGCGNEITTIPEECDDGNDINGDGCDENCSLTACGNSILTEDEGCDDGNLIDGDDCDSNCTPTGCGNGITTDGEECDDGNQEPGDGCEVDCSRTPRCDDGLKNGSESDVDCGGAGCAPCPGERVCLGVADCFSGLCLNGRCQHATCYDGQRNGEEGDVDCGGWSGIVEHVEAGGHNTCLFMRGGRLACFGNNETGQLALGDNEARGDTPNETGDNTRFYGDDTTPISQIALADEHRCALLSNGDIWCTGTLRHFAPALPRDNPNVGDDPDETIATFPPFSQPLDPFTAVTVGDNFNCALSRSGQVLCWGQNNAGQLGQGIDAPSISFDEARPVDLGSDQVAVAVDAGGETACALLANRSLKCWGANERGQLGSRQRDPRGTHGDHMGDNLAPIDLGTDRYAVQFSVGAQFACAVLDNGGLKCWGSNQSGQLGQNQGWLSHGTGRNHMGDSLPEIIRLNDAPWTRVETGRETVCALSTLGELICWGDNERGQLGRDDRRDQGRGPEDMDSLIPLIFTAGERVLNISLGAEHACAVLSSGRTRCWGANGSGQLVQGHLDDLAASADNPLAAVDDIDVGTNCPRCPADAQCERGRQCASGICRDNLCRAPGCFDGITNANETDFDCGGPDCAGCVNGSRCIEHRDCISLSCQQIGLERRCTPATCEDLALNGQETDVDCGGGVCSECDDGQACQQDDDCRSEQCLNGRCTSCRDGIQNGDETGIDCGGLACPACQAGETCLQASDCASNQCAAGTCISCDDGMQNGDESDLDCGGEFCPGCSDDNQCRTISDCASNQCEDGRCISCNDGILNGDEVIIDCGGALCPGCLPDQPCRGAVDCESEMCVGDICRPATCFDEIRNGDEGDQDCGAQRAVVQSISAGYTHTCSLLAGGQVKCFGNNDDGQLGYGDDDSRIALETLGNALSVVALPEPMTQVYAGHSQTCALAASGNAYCWGLNRDGQLGAGHQRNLGDDPDEMGAALPAIQLPGAPQIHSLCLGSAHTCALHGEGAVSCWGSNTRGQLGQNDRVIRGTTPESLASLNPVELGQSAIAIACGDLHSCALLSDGTAKCWGDSALGQLGQETEFPIGDNQGEMGDLNAISLGINARISQLSAGAGHTCALFESGELKCWGQDAFGALGVPAAGHRGDDINEMGAELPEVDFAPETHIASVHTGNGTTCVRTDAHRVYCWGSNGRYGTVGQGRPNPVIRWNGEAGAAVPLETGRGILALSLHAHHVCAHLADYTLRCWGWNEDGQLGIGDQRTRGRAPADIPALLTSVSLGSGCDTCQDGARCTQGVQCASGVCTDGLCRSEGCQDEVLNGDETDVDCGGPSCPACGTSQTCLVDRDCGDAFCINGQCSTCGDETQNGLETDVDCGGPDCGPCREGQRCAAQLDCVTFACAIRGDVGRCVERSCEDGLQNGGESDVDCGGPDCAGCPDAARCAQPNDCASGQCQNERCVSCEDGLQNGAETDLDCGGVCRPCSAADRCLVNADCESTLCIDGHCTYAHCADGVRNGSEGDVDCGGETPVVSVAAGADHTCARFADGVIKCFGSNENGQLGLGDTSPRGILPEQMDDHLSPVDLGMDARVHDLSAGWAHTCALLESGEVYCWGANGSGQLGTGDALPRRDHEERFALTEVRFGSNLRVDQIVSGGAHNCVRFEDGRVKCWGSNSHGQLGLEDGRDRGGAAEDLGDALPFVDFGMNRRATGLSAGGQHTCALLEDGALVCWGRGNEGQLGTGHGDAVGDEINEMGARLTSVNIGSEAEITRFATGQNHTCALDTAGIARCWGANIRGQLGRNSVETIGDDPGEMGRALVPVIVRNPIVDLATGWSHTCAILDSGRLLCFGENHEGQLGLGSQEGHVGGLPGDMENTARTVDLGPIYQTLSIAAGDGHTCVIIEGPQLKCWGRNRLGQLGLGDVARRGVAEEQMGIALSSPILGRLCDQCDVGETCDAGFQCRSLICGDNDRCSFLDCDEVDCPTCWDGQQNGDERDVDCGGPCPACEVGQMCVEDLDCNARICHDGLCSSCTDRRQNGAETDVDCGGDRCASCPEGGACQVGADCESGLCDGNTCVRDG